MYLNFYQLKKQPFHITPDPEFLYLSPSHKEAMSAIIYGISERKGFIAIIGAVGVGKTTILRSYLEKAERKHLKLVYIFNARLTFKELIRSIYQELGLHIEHTGTLEMVNQLYEELIKEYKEGNTVVLIIDEAQNMPIDTLESLRMLSNLETSKDKLIQIVLVGQPEFEVTLNLDRLRQLKQRIAIRATIKALTDSESAEYLKYRIKMAGGNPNLIFSSSALKKIIEKSNGIPRKLNIISDNALITGFGYQKKPVSAKIVNEIVKDLENTAMTKKKARKLIPVAAACMLVIICFGFVWTYRDILRNLAVPTSSANRFEFQAKGPDKPEKKLSPENVTVAEKETQPASPAVSRSQAGTAKSNDKMEAPKKGDGETMPVKKTRTTVTRKMVVHGDTLTKLANEVYGKSDDEVIGMVQGQNPQISDPNLIHAGSTIIFPDLTQHKKSEKQP